MSIPSRQIDIALHDILNEGADAVNVKVEGERRVTLDGARGLEIRAKAPDGYAAQLVVLSSRNRIYMLGVHAKHGTKRLYDALVASFLII